MEEKYLIVGRGFLGKILQKELINNGEKSEGTDFTLKDENHFLDITNIDTIKNIFSKHKPSIIINCAAVTNVDFLEVNSNVAYSINSEGPKNLAKICKENDSKLIHISTDSVFDGQIGSYSEEDIPNPINIYAKSKLLGENYVHKELSNSIIIRTNFFGHNQNRKFLLEAILKNLKEKKQFIGFEDVIFNPLEIRNLCKMIIELTKKDFSGIIHLSSNEIISKYEFALNVAKIFGFDENLIKKGKIEDFDLKAKRPKNTSLDNSKSKNILKTEIISLKKALQQIRDDENISK